MRVSHQTIYTSLFVQTKGVLRGELSAQLRTQRVRRRPQRRMSLASRRNRIPDMVGIAGRPRCSTEPSPGTGRVTCWSAATGAATWHPGRTAQPVLARARDPGRHHCDSRGLGQPRVPRAARTHARIADLGPRSGDDPARRRHCCDQDAGLLLRRLQPLAARQQRGHKRLLRQYFPKKTDLSLITPEQLQAVVEELNQRPRQSLAWKTPHEVFWSAALAITA
jgi:transposase, IS30 family